jgi:hypothetical protein
MTIFQWYVGGAYAMPLTPVFPPSPKQLFDNIHYPKLTKLTILPSFLEQLIPLLREDDNRGFQAMVRFQFVAYGGASCSPYVCQELVEHGTNLINMLGATGQYKMVCLVLKSTIGDITLKEKTFSSVVFYLSCCTRRNTVCCFFL